MAGNSVELKALPAPIDAQITVGGALPFNWEVHDYTKVDNGWTNRRVGAGRDDSWVRVESVDPIRLAGHRLLWSVAAVDFDSDPLEVDVTVNFKAGDGTLRSVSGKWKCTPDNPNLYVTIQVEP
jgi:hypothetical protein